MNVALIVAGGSGVRFGGNIPKQYCKLPCGQYVVGKTIVTFATHPLIDLVFVVIHCEHFTYYSKMLDDSRMQNHVKLVEPICGGSVRQASVYLGLQHIQSCCRPKNVLIHDAARPFVSHGIIKSVIKALDTDEAIDVGLPVVDTIKTYDGTVISRETAYMSQTPQGFRYDIIMDLHRRINDIQAQNMQFTDDISIYIASGRKSLGIVQGDSRNFKITYQSDLARL